MIFLCHKVIDKDPDIRLGTIKNTALFSCSFLAAFTPAIKPERLPSSYPELPLNWPPENSPSIFLNSRDAFNCLG